MERRMRRAELREEMEGLAEADSTSPLEELLVHRIVVCWLQLHYVETLFAQRTAQGVSLDAVRYYQNWLDGAHKRYLAAMKALATIRKLGVPAIQVNIGEKQVNVAGGCGKQNDEA